MDDGNRLRNFRLTSIYPNLEKDPKAIAAQETLLFPVIQSASFAMENEGYAGRANHPARENHRIIPVTINDSPWGFQYSPYVYYNEHCIVFNGEHTPMKIERNTFVKLFVLSNCFRIISSAQMPIFRS